MRLLFTILTFLPSISAHATCADKVVVGTFETLLEEKAKQAAKIAAGTGPLEAHARVTHAMALPDGAAFAVVVSREEDAREGDVFLVNVKDGGEALALRQTHHEAAVEAIVQAHIAGDYRMPGLWLGSSPRIEGAHAVSVLPLGPTSGFVIMEFLATAVELAPAEYRMVFVVVDGEVVAEGDAVKQRPARN